MEATISFRLAALLLSLTLTLLVAPLPAEAQKAEKVPLVSFLLENASPDAASPDPSQGVRKQLHELGYVEGVNIAFESRWAQGRVERLPGLAAELIRLKANVIVTVGTLATLAAKRATTTIPIVMVSGVDPVGIGLVASLARPGGNVTGVTSLTGELSGKRLDLLREAVPKVSRLAVLWDPTNPSTAFELRETQFLARSLVKRVSIQAVGVRGPDEFESAFAAMTREGARALIVLPNAMFFTERRRLADLAVEHRLPTIFGQREEAEAGGLIAYGANFTDLFQRAATYVDKILRGVKPADLPVEQPTRYQLVINLKTAKGIGLTIPLSVLIRADEVIE